MFRVFVVILVLGMSAACPARAEQHPKNSFAGQILTDASSGRVGVGTALPTTTLDIYQGEVKIGSTGAACTKEIAGALRCADNRLLFCDGKSWRNVSLDKAE